MHKKNYINFLFPFFDIAMRLVNSCWHFFLLSEREQWHNHFKYMYMYICRCIMSKPVHKTLYTYPGSRTYSGSRHQASSTLTFICKEIIIIVIMCILFSFNGIQYIVTIHSSSFEFAPLTLPDSSSPAVSQNNIPTTNERNKVKRK